MMASKYYWLKLPNNFFSRHDIKVIKGMDNGEKYVIFYQQLLLESITHEGELRFSDMVPYDETMLATITDTDVDVVRSAMRILIQLGMIQILDDATIYMTECKKMIGKTDSSAERTRLYRERKAQQLPTPSDCDVTVTSPSNSISNSNSNSNSDIPNDTNIPNDIVPPPKAKKEPKTKKPKPPNCFEDVVEYAKSRGVWHLAKEFYDYYEAGDWYDGKGEPILSWKQKFITWQSNAERRGMRKGNPAATAFESAISRQDLCEFE